MPIYFIEHFGVGVFFVCVLHSTAQRSRYIAPRREKTFHRHTFVNVSSLMIGEGSNMHKVVVKSIISPWHKTNSRLIVHSDGNYYNDIHIYIKIISYTKPSTALWFGIHFMAF